MEYRGYVAAVEFDESADILHGRVVNSGSYPIATFEARDTNELRQEFERSIDEYLAWCEEDGVEPKKPFSGKLNVRLGSELHGMVAAAAAAEGMSINSWIVRALRAASGSVPRSTRLAAQATVEDGEGTSSQSTSE
ncbi:MAG: type II toxin-antitoxin system HicB family antitoxin [Acidobacteriia bacterium]|nr:type II toxin-antitoxin system HicB family antitoxin [Terriglobia bacterium]MYB52525.1 type II toxin-antitoxin system HicB family antitoxin [Terriglobia bacterium]MYC66030.1 type II toxin-antitoxin system HicB family antitoxin [Terriglobia bacterium]MYG01412.1 type II toxin-antitoxin system HicB family antitoxin [Terriglobia bacterium]MYK08914.1 type II toxin-antitoxin system HicB family antitoxin [Terriglobia bacterium]